MSEVFSFCRNLVTQSLKNIERKFEMSQISHHTSELNFEQVLETR